MSDPIFAMIVPLSGSGLHPGHDLPGVHPGHPDQGLPGGSAGAGQLPSIPPPPMGSTLPELPPGAVWPPLPPGVNAGKHVALIWISGVGYRWTVIDTGLTAGMPLPPVPEPKSN